LEGRPYKYGFGADNNVEKDKSSMQYIAHIESMNPNPATNQVVVKYNVGNAMSAHLIVYETATAITASKQILNCSQSQTVLDVSSLNAGVYTVILVCDGQFIESKKLVVQ